jgi:hypothetical protein
MRPAMAIALVAAALSGAAPAQAETGLEVPASVEATPIVGTHVLKRHVFTFQVVSPCRGPGLKLDHVRRVERPRTEEGVKVAVVTAYLFHPAHVEGLPCPEILQLQTVRIRTKRPAPDLVFFDGSSSPPRRVLPIRGAKAGR